MRRVWLVPLLIGAVIVTALGFVPTDDGSYRCDAPPGVLLVDPAPARASEDFFDEGTKCNADARGRGLAMALVVGAAVSVAFVVRLAERSNAGQATRSRDVER